jgi:hypothetical protein
MMPSDIMAHSVARQANFLECYIRVWPSGSDGQHNEAIIMHIESAQSGSPEDVHRYLRETCGDDDTGE